MESKQSASLEAIINERNGLRSEIIELESGFLKCALAFVTVSVAILGITLNDTLIKDTVLRNGLLVAFTQIEFFIGMIGIALLSNMNCHAGYLEAIEKKINLICNDTITIWESHITKNVMLHWKGTYSQVIFLIIVFLVIIYGYLLIKSFTTINSFFYGVICTLEVLLTIYFLIKAQLERDKVSKITEKELNVTVQTTS